MMHRWYRRYEQRPVPPVRDNKISTYRRPSLRFFSSDKIGYGGSDRFDEDNYISFTDPPNMREVHPPGILPIGKPVTTEEYEEFGPYGKNEQQYDLEKEDYEAPSYGPIAPDRKGPKRKQKPQFMRILPEPSHDRETQRTSYKNEREQEKKNRRPYEENNLSQGGQPSTPRPGRPHVTSGYYVRILPRPSHNRERQRTSHKNEREREEKNRRPYEENNLSQGGPPSIPGQIEVPPSSHEFEEGEPNEPYQPEGSEQNPYLGQPKLQPKNAGEEKAEKVVPHTNLPLIELATRSPHVTVKVTLEDMDKKVPESENEPN
ncbi:unnamed protein product [Toxocara canis]|uniref:Uncharacterized protein n=1 Tax=Toxocara canis TaxID=6265 RepID=A0A183TXQ8_TOXCA|nr:unnamed protein product [Toxocara canis]